MFASKRTQLKALNYIPTSCSRAKFLILVTFLNLAIIHVYGEIPFKFCSYICITEITEITEIIEIKEIIEITEIKEIIGRFN